MKSDHVSGTSNQIPSTDEIMPDLLHSGIFFILFYFFIIFFFIIREENHDINSLLDNMVLII